MRTEPSTSEKLRAENAALRARLEEAEQTLQATRGGEANVPTTADAIHRGPAPQDLNAESSRFSNEVLALVSDAVIAVDDDRRVTYLNPAAERQYGVTASNVLGHHVTDVFQYRWLHPDDEASVTTALRETGHWRGEIIHVKRNGDVIHVEASATQLPTGCGLPSGQLAVLRDITERKEAEKKLEMSERRFRALTEKTSEDVILVDAHGQIIYENPHQNSVLGFGKGELTGRNGFELVHPDDQPHARHILEAMLRQPGESTEGEVRARRKDGDWIWIRFIGTNLLHDSAVGALVINLRDITARKQAEELLRESSKFNQGVLDSLPAHIAVLDAKGTVIAVNESWRCFAREHAGDASDRVEVGANYLAVFRNAMDAGDDSARQALEGIESVLSRQQTEFLLEYPCHSPTQRRWFLMQVIPDRERGGVIVSHTDISRRKLTEDVLARSEARLQQAVKVAGLGLFEHDHLTDEIYYSRLMLEICGWSDEETVTLDKIINLVAPEDRPAFAAAVQRAHDPAGNGRFASEHRIVRPDGTVRWVNARAQTAFDGGENDRHPVRTVGALVDITERKEAEEALRRSQEDLDRAQRVGQIGSWRLDVRRNVLTWSAESYRIFGAPPGAPLTYDKFLEIVHPVDREYVDQQWNAALRGEPYDIEHRIIVDGQVKWVREKAYLELNEQGALLGGFGIAQDITERKEAELKLKMRERRYRALTEKTTEDIILLDAEGRITYESPHEVSLLGYRPGELLGHDGFELVHPDDLGRARQALKHIIGSPGEATQGEIRMRRKDGGWNWIHFYGTNLLHEPAVGAVVVNLHNITERKRAEAALRDSERRFKTMADTAPAMLWITEPDGSTVFLSRGWYEYTGQTQDNALGSGWMDAVHPEDREKAKRHFLTSNERHEPFALDYRLCRRDGAYRWVIDAGRPRFDPVTGYFLGYIGSVIDIHQRKEAEAALRLSEEKYRRIVRLLPAAVYTVDADGLITFYNERAVELWGRAPALEDTDQRFCGSLRLYRPDGSLLPPEATPMAEAVRTGASSRGQEVTIEHPDGKRVTVLVNVDPLLDSDGKIAGAINVFTDITELKHAEEAVRQSEQKYRTLFETIDEGFCVVEMIFDQNDRPVDYRFVEINPAFEKHSGIQDAKGRRMREIAPQHEEKWFQIYGQVARVGEPVRFEQRAEQLNRWLDVYAYRYGPPESRQVAVLFNDVSERRQAEEALRNRSERLALLSDATSALLTASDPTMFLDGIFSRMSELLDLEIYAHYLLSRNGTELELAAARGLSDEETAQIETLDLGDGICGAVAATRLPVLIEDLQHCPDPRADLARALGVTAYTSHPLLAKGRVVGTLSFGTRRRTSLDPESLTLIQTVCNQIAAAIERRQNEDALRESEQTLRLVIDTVPHGIFAKDAAGRHVLANRTIAQFAGRMPSQMVGRTDAELYGHTADVEAFRRDDLSVIRSGAPLFIPEETITDANGQKHVLQTTKVPFTVPETGESGVLGVCVDITERKQAEDALRYHFNLLQSVTENTAAAIFVTDEHGRITFVNREATNTFGYSPIEMIDHVLHERLHRHHPDGRDYPVEECPLMRCFITGEDLRNHEDVFFHKNGTHVNVSCSNGHLEVDGQPHGSVIVVHDITARKNAEDALRRSRDELEQRVAERTVDLAQMNEQLRAEIVERISTERTLRRQSELLNMASDAILVRELDGTIRYWSGGAERLYGFTADQALGRNSSELLGTFCPDGLKAVHSELMKNHVWTGEFTQTTKSSQRIIVESRMQLVNQPDGARLVLETNHDVTERLLLHDEIVAVGERERERFGQDLHDGVCQMLTAARLKADAVAARLTGSNSTEQDAAKAAAKIVAQALDEARNLARGLEPVEPLPEGLMVALQHLARSTKHLFGVNCTCIFRRPVLVAEHGVAMELFRIVQEAINNAVKHSRAKKIRIQIVKEDEAAVLKVTCDGKPFPKHPRGTGLGLKTMNFRAQRINAKLDIRPGPNGGTTVRCVLPNPTVNAIASEITLRRPAHPRQPSQLHSKTRKASPGR